MTKSQQILACPPDWDAYKIADHVGTTYGYVHNVWSRNRMYRVICHQPRQWRMLTPDQVRAIRRDFRPLHVISVEYGISASAVCKIRALKSRMDVV
jgi:hypothetical protein